MTKKKSKDLLLAEIAYRDGRMDALVEGIVDTTPEHEDEVVEAGAAISLKKWKEQTGGRKPEPTDVEIARKEWIAAGKLPEGIRTRGGQWFKFKPSGEFDLTASSKANFGYE